MARKSKKPSDDEQDPLHRDNVPGELEHASGQVDEFDARLVSGADGEVADPAAEAELTRQAEAAAPAAVAPKLAAVYASL